MENDAYFGRNDQQKLISTAPFISSPGQRPALAEKSFNRSGIALR